MSTPVDPMPNLLDIDLFRSRREHAAFDLLRAEPVPG